MKALASIVAGLLLAVAAAASVAGAADANTPAALRDGAARSAAPGTEVGLVYRDDVQVDEDGNGVQSAQFATTVAGPNVRYLLVVENGCATAGPCSAPVNGLTVTLNDDVVFQNDDEFTQERVEVALNPVDARDDNTLALAARGNPGSQARVRIIALQPKPPALNLVHRDDVHVDEDGNGVQSAQFATTVPRRQRRPRLASARPDPRRSYSARMRPRAPLIRRPAPLRPAPFRPCSSR
jgi:hypothetical protein